MKVAALSALTVLAISANALTLYQDPTTGQVYTKEGEDRVELGKFDKTEEAKVHKDTKSKGNQITIMRKDSPEFLLGKETKINMKFVPDDNKDMWLKMGIRVQGTFENKQTDYVDPATADTDVWDAYLRRTRLEVQAGFGHGISYVMDIRNDKVNYEDKGEQTFNVGDAYLKIKKPFGTSLVNFRLYRGKIDVSRTETVKSARVLHYDRPQVADEAAQYITHNRRGTNIKMHGNWDKKVHYEIAAGDGIHSGKFKDATGATIDGDLTQESFFYGGKLRLSPFDGWEEKKRTETYFGQGQHFSIGAAYWKSPEIAYDDGVVFQKIDHELVNLEMSAHYKGAFIQAEYFEFDGVVKAWGNTETGKSNGWYATGEYVIEDLAYLAPFVRYEKWDKYENADGYDFTTKMAGVNWYLRGNTTKIGLVYQEDEYESELKSGARTQQRIKLTSQWFF